MLCCKKLWTQLHSFSSLLLLIFLFHKSLAAGFNVIPDADNNNNPNSPPHEAAMSRGEYPAPSPNYEPEIPGNGENQVDYDDIDDRTLHDLLMVELGSETENLLRRLFGGINFNSLRSSKRSGSQPKFNPGWKFIGLGKRRSFSPMLSGKPKDAVFAYQWNAPVENLDVTDPYLGALALSNLEKFFSVLKDELHGNSGSDDDLKKLEDVSSSAHGDPAVNPRFRNKMSWWGEHQKSLYDPGWLMTGLGR